LKVSRVSQQRVPLGALELGQLGHVVHGRRDVHSVEGLEVVDDEAEHCVGALRIDNLVIDRAAL
jgi:hypothetical protein